MLIRIFGTLAVVLLIVCGFLGWRASAASSRADAAESRAEALQGELEAAEQAITRDDVASKATDVARKAADARQPEREARAAKVKDYADSAVSPCAADPRIVRELREGADRFRAGEARLRGDGQPEGKAADPADD